MNTTTRTAVVATAAIIAIGTASAPAFAVPPRGPDTSGSRPSIGSPFAERIDAIGGRTMAQYVAEHMARRVG